MAHSFVNQLLHCVFSTKERRPLISPDLHPRLYPYFGGIARENKMKLMAAGGTAGHVHLLISLPSTLAIAKAMHLVKGGSSKWVHEHFAGLRQSAWQEGYGAFSIRIGDAKRTVDYINRQAEHHRRRDYKMEFMAILRKHDVEYDERYIFD
jgi:REP element-mobilizing transposase RayT